MSTTAQQPPVPQIAEPGTCVLFGPARATSATETTTIVYFCKCRFAAIVLAGQLC